VRRNNGGVEERNVTSYQNGKPRREQETETKEDGRLESSSERLLLTINS